jgi:hypothetical protein
VALFANQGCQLENILPGAGTVDSYMSFLFSLEGERSISHDSVLPLSFTTWPVLGKGMDDGPGELPMKINTETPIVYMPSQLKPVQTEYSNFYTIAIRIYSAYELAHTSLRALTLELHIKS